MSIDLTNPVIAARFINLASDEGPHVLRMALNEVITACGDNLHDFITVKENGVSVNGSRLFAVLESVEGVKTKSAQERTA